MHNFSTLLDKAHRLFKTGDLTAAAPLYQQVLEIDANNLVSLTNLGIIHLANSNYQESARLLKQVIALDPTSVAANSNLGLILLNSGKYREAAERFLVALSKEPGHAYLWNDLGDALLKSGQTDGADECYQKAIKIDPGYVDSYLNLGKIALNKKNSGKIAEAIGYFTKALSLLDENNLKSHYAISWLEAHLSLGKIALEEKNLSEAAAHFKTILTLEPNHLEAHLALGEMALEEENLPGASAHFETILTFEPNNLKAHLALGKIALKENDYQKSAECYEKVLLLDPKCEQAHCDLAYIYYTERQNLDKAFYHTNQALSISPDKVWVCKMQVELLILTGQWQEGFNRCTKYYPFGENQRTPVFQAFQSLPRWQGETFSGKRLVIGPHYGLGGLGDIIMLSRYFPQVKERGGYVSIPLWRELLRLFENFHGIDEIFLCGIDEIIENVTPENFDLHIPIVFLPDIFGISPNNIPSKTPYLPIRPDLNNAFKKLMNADNKLKVGLVWSCGNKVSAQRTCGIKVLEPLNSLAEITYYSLQIGQAAQELLKYKSTQDIIDLTHHISDFADTAALIHNLDLVISVDTAVAHLAGAMGKPVWLILPFVSDGKWLLSGSTTSWYPTMRIFRSKTPGNWSGVVEELCRHLQLVCQNRDLLL